MIISSIHSLTVQVPTIGNIDIRYKCFSFPVNLRDFLLMLVGWFSELLFLWRKKIVITCWEAQIYPDNSFSINNLDSLNTLFKLCRHSCQNHNLLHWQRHVNLYIFTSMCFVVYFAFYRPSGVLSRHLIIIQRCE